MSNPSKLMNEAAQFGREMIERLGAERPEDLAALAKATLSGRIQYDVRIRDVLGGTPSVDLIVVTAEGEHVVGSHLFRKSP